MISVVMPAYNVERYIRKAIESILNQTYRDLELIVVDDGSTDATAEIVREYSVQDSRVTLLQTERQGVAAAANLAMETAQYPWIARMDADDIALPHRFIRQLAAAQAEPDVILWGSYAYQINEMDERIGYMEHGPISHEEFYRIRSDGQPVFILNPTTMVRREPVLALGGFDTQFIAAADEELWSRLAKQGVMKVIPEHLLLYRIHGSSITSKRARYQMHVHKFIAARYKAWREGGDLTFQQFLALRRERPLYLRLLEYLGETGRMYWRRGGARIAAKQYGVAAGLLVIAALLNPRFSAERLLQRLSRKMRLNLLRRGRLFSSQASPQ